jgi:hypothetical protein
MPDVTGKKLDVAKSAIKDAGFEDEVKVDGGGVFGVVDESNWEVCEQAPGPGKAVSDAARLTVDRSCGDDAEPSDTPEPTETPEPSDTPEPSETPSGQALTKRNNDEFAALLKVPDTCDERVASFVAEYAGRTIEFDGSIANLAKLGETRYDILIAPGNKGPNSTVGPSFKFEDVNVFDLNLTGEDVPDSVGEGDRFHFVAKVVDGFTPDNCLLFLEPVSTRAK